VPAQICPLNLALNLRYHLFFLRASEVPAAGIGNSHRKGLRPGWFNPCSAPALPVQTWGTRPEGRLACKDKDERRRDAVSDQFASFCGLPAVRFDQNAGDSPTRLTIV
jgi:hypothetical protein